MSMTRRDFSFFLLGSPLLARFVGAQQAGNGPDPKAMEGVDQKKIDEAVAEGIELLKRLKEKKGDPNSDELVLLTLYHGGVAKDDPLFEQILKRMIEAPLESTYNVALQAVVLEKLDPQNYQARIYECAQFLADNQSKNGQWSYGQPIAPVKPAVPTPANKSDKGTRALRRLSVLPRPPMGGDNPRAGGDYSNTQYAALGLRACHDAGIVFPKELIQRARQAWIDGQQKHDAGGAKGVATGGAAPARGWGYRFGDESAWGSMTAGGVGAVVIYDHILGIDWKRDPAVLSGIAWLAKHFVVTCNPERQGNYFHHYYLYGLERAGTLFGSEKFGPHYWYREGAKFLLETQDGGAWHDEDGGGHGWGKILQCTCFAILFLRRATKPLVDVASVDPNKKPGK
jgi:hypothetical protein